MVLERKDSARLNSLFSSVHIYGRRVFGTRPVETAQGGLEGVEGGPKGTGGN